MKETYLIQRLKTPHPVKKGSVLSSEVLSFGGGLRNGGLSKEAMSLLRPIFSFDYMGAAEFEYGAVPEALSKIAKNRKSYREKKINLGEHSVWIFGKKEDMEEIENILKRIYKDEYKVSLKEYPRFKASLNEEKYHDKNIGWLELDNGFFFFKDEVAFNKLVKLFSE